MAVEQYSLVANDWLNLESIINDLTQRVIGQELHPTSSPTFADMTVTGDFDITGDMGVTGDLDIGGTVTFDDLTASRLVATDASKGLESKDLVDLVAGTANQVVVTDDAAGGVVVSGPQDLHTGADPTFLGLNITAVSSLPGTVVVGKFIHLTTNNRLYFGRKL